MKMLTHCGCNQTATYAVKRLTVQSGIKNFYTLPNVTFPFHSHTFICSLLGGLGAVVVSVKNTSVDKGKQNIYHCQNPFNVNNNNFRSEIAGWKGCTVRSSKLVPSPVIIRMVK
jgi:hypothetical protein